VWSGKAAQSLGLVDNLGNFDDAVAAASLRANLTGYKVRFIEDEPAFSDQFAEWLFAKSGLEPIKAPLKPSVAEQLWKNLEKTISRLGALNDPNSVYLLCEGCDIR